MMSRSVLDKEKNFISVVVYMYNSEATISYFLKKLNEIFSEYFNAYEFILVNDDSKDSTVALAREALSDLKENATVINLAWKHGLELAMLAGTDMAIGDFVFEFDSTIINYDLELIIDTYRECLEGYDIVAVSERKHQKLSSRLFYKFLNHISYKKMKLTTETFRIVSRRAINRVSMSKEKIRYRKALYHYSGLNTAVLFYNASNSMSNVNLGMTTGAKISLGLDVLISNSNIGTRIAGLISSIFLIFAIVAGVYAISVYATLDYIEPGWTTTMLFLSASFAGLFLILFVISKYLTTILFEIQERPSYIFKSIEKVSKSEEKIGGSLEVVNPSSNLVSEGMR
ncbi:glycosyltransferase [Paenibacillus thiaminolyticus]|uniref:glycosyltransferase n=1 Tax=Paenibacillus thiaminolyticus TaxID=49283 RepID=UPI003D28D422